MGGEQGEAVPTRGAHREAERQVVPFLRVRQLAEASGVPIRFGPTRSV